MQKTYSQIKELIFEQIKTDPRQETKYKFSDIFLKFHTNSDIIKSHIISFFQPPFYPATKKSTKENITIYFLAVPNRKNFPKILLKRLKDNWNVIHKSGSSKRSLAFFSLKKNPHILLFKVTDLLTIINTDTKEGFYLIPEKHIDKTILDKSVFFYMISVLFWEEKYFLIHSSCVSDSNGNGVLITGKSGAGKTTLCMKMVKEKFNFISNDLILLKEREKYIEAIGLPDKNIKVRKKTISLFPEIKSHIKKWDQNKRAHIPTNFYSKNNRKLKCKIKILAIGNKYSNKYRLAKNFSFNYVSLIPTLNFFIPNINYMINEKLNFITKLLNTSDFFHFNLPRNFKKLKVELDKNAKKIIEISKYL